MNISQAIINVQQVSGLGLSAGIGQTQQPFACTRTPFSQPPMGAMPEIWRPVGSALAAGAFNPVAPSVVRVGDRASLAAAFRAKTLRSSSAETVSAAAGSSAATPLPQAGVTIPARLPPG